ncbi:hypothetical protein SPWS13_0001 [Shewanella putrefaciens]|nr:hypothetical protein SPWS13_0001 [Shewanella putrefaciens]
MYLNARSGITPKRKQALTCCLQTTHSAMNITTSEIEKDKKPKPTGLGF